MASKKTLLPTNLDKVRCAVCQKPLLTPVERQKKTNIEFYACSGKGQKSIHPLYAIHYHCYRTLAPSALKRAIHDACRESPGLLPPVKGQGPLPFDAAVPPGPLPPVKGQGPLPFADRRCKYCGEALVIVASKFFVEEPSYIT